MDGYGQIQIDIEDRQRSVWKEIDRYRYRYRQMQTDLDRYRQIQMDGQVFLQISMQIYMKIQIQIDIDKDRLYRQSETDERVRQTEKFKIRYGKIDRQIDRQIGRDRDRERERERAGQEKKIREIERSEIQKDQIDQVSLKGWIDRLESRGKLDRKI